MKTQSHAPTFPLKTGAKKRWHRRRTRSGRMPGRATPAIVTALCGANATLGEITRRSGLSRRYITEVFSGRSGKWGDTAIALADAMGVDERTLLRSLAEVRRQRVLRELLNAAAADDSEEYR